MVSILITDTNLVCAEWSSSEDKKRIVTNLFSIPFDHSLSSIFQNETEINSTIEIAFRHIIENISISGKKVSVILHQNIVREETLSVTEKLYKDDLYDYFQWRLTQKWGSNHRKLNQLFVQNYPENPECYLLSQCNAHLIEILKLTISEHSGIPVWLGSHSTVIFDKVDYNTVYLYEENQSYKYLHRGKDEISTGTFRIQHGGIKYTGLSEDDEKKSILNKDSSLILMDEFSDKKQDSLKSIVKNIQRPASDINFEGVIVSDEITQSELNLLSLFINYSQNTSNINYFESNQMMRWDYPPKKKIKLKKKKAKAGKAVKETKSKESKQYPAFIYFTLTILFFGLIYLNNIDSINTLFITRIMEHFSASEQETEEPQSIMEEEFTLIQLLQKHDSNRLYSFTVNNGRLDLSYYSTDSLAINMYDVDISKNIKAMEIPNAELDSEPFTIESLTDTLSALYNGMMFYSPEYEGNDFVPLMTRIETDLLPIEVVEMFFHFPRNVQINKIKSVREDPNSKFVTVFYLSVVPTKE